MSITLRILVLRTGFKTGLLASRCDLIFFDVTPDKFLNLIIPTLTSLEKKEGMRVRVATRKE